MFTFEFKNRGIFLTQKPNNYHPYVLAPDMLHGHTLRRIFVDWNFWHKNMATIIRISNFFYNILVVFVTCVIWDWESLLLRGRVGKLYEILPSNGQQIASDKHKPNELWTWTKLNENDSDIPKIFCHFVEETVLWNGIKTLKIIKLFYPLGIVNI